MVAIRTAILKLKNSPELSDLIGNLESQQRLAYNWAVDQLNRQPALPARTSQKKGLTDTLSSRCGRVRQGNPAKWWGPFHIHQAGYEQAHLANERFAADRAARLARIAAAEAKGEVPKRRDIRPHRRTLSQRARKNGQSLTINSHHHLTIAGPRIFYIKGLSKTGRNLPVETLSDLPERVLSIRFVEIGHSAKRPFRQRRYCLHVSAAFSDPAPAPLETIDLSDIIGLDDGVKRRWSTSGVRGHYDFAEPYPDRNIRKIRSKLAGQPKRSKRRRKIERREREKNRRRQAERARQFQHHAIALIRDNQPKAIAIEDKSYKGMMASAKGTAESPGKKVRAKAGLNRSLADAALSDLGKILKSQADKAGVLLSAVPAPGSSKTCSRCGCRHKKNREIQAVFQCRECRWRMNADINAAFILRNRLHYRIQTAAWGYTPWRDEAPTGWSNQPSRYGQMALMLSTAAQNALKPGGTATRGKTAPGLVSSRPDGVGGHPRPSRSTEGVKTPCASLLFDG